VSRFESLTKRTIFTYSGKPSWRWQQAALCSPHALCSLLLQRCHKFWLATPAVMDPSAFSLATSGFTCPFYLLSCDECAQSLWVLFRRCFFALPCLQVWSNQWEMWWSILQVETIGKLGELPFRIQLERKCAHVRHSTTKNDTNWCIQAWS
jgi:hypothetical protein